MLRLRRCILTHLPSSPSASPIPFHLYRLVSATTPADSPNPSFAVEEYLVDTCGLARSQALKASPKLSHLKSPTNPDAVRAFLFGLGLSTADVSAIVAKDPKLLCSSVERTLTPNVAGFTALGLSRDAIARLVLLARKLRYRSTVSNLQYFLPIFGSFENLFRALKFNTNILSCNLERTAKPNVAFLRECGLGDRDIAKLGMSVPRMLTTDLEHLRETVACAEGVGVPRGSGMFRLALRALAYLDKEKITTKVDYLKNMFRWSDAEVGIAVSKFPNLLGRSKDILQSRSKFLFSEVVLEPAYIAHRPGLLCYSLGGRLKPRYYVLKFLKGNGLLDPDRDYYAAVKVSEKVFVEKYICPHSEVAPHLVEDYAAACRGEVPPRFLLS